MTTQELKEILKKRKITYAELSKMSGVPINTIQNFMSNRISSPRIDTMQAIENALGFVSPTAVAHGLIDRSPLAIVPAPKHQRVNGTVLTAEEERLLLATDQADKRQSFATRCQQCGIPADVVRMYMGHSLGGVLGKSYTKFTDSYLWEQGQKLLYT